AYRCMVDEQDSVSSPEGGLVVYTMSVLEIGPAFTQYAVDHHFPTVGGSFVAISLLFFAFTTLMAYYYYAETNISYLFKKGNATVAIWVLRIFILVATFYGAIQSATWAWCIGDIGVCIMAWFDIIAFFLLR